jgi:hypothetical protein
MRNILAMFAAEAAAAFRKARLTWPFAGRVRTFRDPVRRGRGHRRRARYIPHKWQIRHM